MRQTAAGNGERLRQQASACRCNVGVCARWRGSPSVASRRGLVAVASLKSRERVERTVQTPVARAAGIVINGPDHPADGDCRRFGVCFAVIQRVAEAGSLIADVVQGKHLW